MKRVYLLVGLVLSVCVLAWFFRGWMAVDVEAQVKACDEFLQAYTRLHRFNGTALIAKDGRVLLSKGYGEQDASSGAANEADTVFRIYSITKPFTSAVVLKLVEQEKLSLSDTLDQFYPELPNAQKITIEHLLSHTSGLYEFTREVSFENSESSLIQLLKDRPVDFAPGEGWSYCNSGYCLLGHIIARVNETSYEQAVAEHVLTPLGMEHTGFLFNSLDASRRAVGYRVFSDSVKAPVHVSDAGGPFAAGALYSNVHDLWLFQMGLNEGGVLSDASLQRAWTPSAQNRGYGLGWQLGSRWLTRKVVSHSGGADGFRSNLSQIPSRGYCVVLLSNIEHSNVEFLTDRIYDLLDGQDVAIPIEESVPLQELEEFVGFYALDGQSGVVRTYMQDDRLAVDFRGMPQGTLIAQGERKFLQPESGVEVEFLSNGDGEYSRMQVKQGRMRLSASRYEGAWGIPESTESELIAALEEHAPSSSEWHESAFLLAHLMAFNEESDRYEALCEQIMKHHGATQSPQIAERTVKACLLYEQSPLLEKVADLADQAYANREQAGVFNWGGEVHWRGYLALAKGMADYRLGNYQEARSSLESAQVFSTQDVHSPCVRDLLLAMAYARLGQDSKARNSMAAAEGAIGQMPASYASGGWNDRILVELIQKQAEAVLAKH